MRGGVTVGVRRLAALVGVALIAASAVAVGNAVQGAAPPVTAFVNRDFGRVLGTPKRQAIYYWEQEKATHTPQCFASCTDEWRPYLVKTRTVPVRVKGVRGKIGVVARVAGKLQLTWNRLPLYTWTHEPPREVLANGRDRFFVVRVPK